MQIEEAVFKYKRFDHAKMLDYGFGQCSGSDSGKGTGYYYESDFMDGDFRATIEVADNGHVTGTVIDISSGEEYDPLRNVNYYGAFVGRVREAYQELLTDIADHCCTDVLFASEQANRIAGLIHDRYGVDPDFPWDSESNADAGVFRHADSSKWFALMMNIQRNRLPGAASPEASEYIDVVNLKKDTAKSDRLADTAGVFPAYHMNHKLWVSVALDDTLSDEDVMQLVDDSYRLTDKKRSGGIDSEIIKHVLLIADCVPPGQVITYGQLAAEAGIPRNARLVGKIMSMADRYGDHPCHRVVAHNGRLVPGWKEQRALLEAEGITFTANGYVNMQLHNIP